MRAGNREAFRRTYRRVARLVEAQRFPDTCCMARCNRDAVEDLKRIEPLGFDEVALRITGGNQREQLEQLIAEVAPHIEAALP